MESTRGKQSPTRTTVLRLALSLGETSASYNQFSLAWTEWFETTICTYLEPTVSPPPDITVFAGDGTLRGAVRAMRLALEAGEYDIVHAHSPHVADLFLLVNLFYRRPRKRTMMTVHNSYQNTKLRSKLLLIPAFAFLGRIVCCGRASLDSFPRFYRWLGGRRLTAVVNGVDLARVDRVTRVLREDRGGETMTVVCVGRLISLKNPLSLVRAFARSRSADRKLVFIGTGPLHDSIVAEGNEHGIAGQLELTGLISREAVFGRLAGADLYISTSRGEGLPIAALEAMVSGLPVVLSDIPPHREIAGDAPFIPLLDPDDVAGFGDAIDAFARMSPAERRQVGKQCRELVETRFSLDAMRDGYQQVYSELSE